MVNQERSPDVTPVGTPEPSPTALLGLVFKPVADVARAWDRFWFRPADPTLLGILRIGCGLVLLWIHVVYTFDLQDLAGKHALFDQRTANEFRLHWPTQAPDVGWGPDEATIPKGAPDDPAEFARAQEYYRKWRSDARMLTAQGLYVFSVWYHVTDPNVMLVIQCGILASMVCFTLGFCTRVTSVLTWLGLLTWIHRSQWTLFGMDTMANILTIYLMIGPSGAALSLDRLIGRFWATRRALAAGRPAPVLGPPAPSVSANFALRLLQIHFCWIYLAAGTSKLLGSAWWSGTATWGTVVNYEFCPLTNPLYAAAMRFLAQNRPLWEVFNSTSVAFTLTLELSFAYLIWNRNLRYLLLLGVMALHSAIAFFMGLTAFSMCMVLISWSFIPLDDLARVRAWIGRGGKRFRLLYRQDSPRQVRTASLIRAVDEYDQIDVTAAAPEEAPDGVALVDARDRTLTGYAAFDALAGALPLLRPVSVLTWITGLSAGGADGGSRRSGSLNPADVSKRPAAREPADMVGSTGKSE